MKDLFGTAEDDIGDNLLVGGIGFNLGAWAEQENLWIEQAGQIIGDAGTEAVKHTGGVKQGSGNNQHAFGGGIHSLPPPAYAGGSPSAPWDRPSCAGVPRVRRRSGSGRRSVPRPVSTSVRATRARSPDR